MCVLLNFATQGPVDDPPTPIPCGLVPQFRVQIPWLLVFLCSLAAEQKVSILSCL